MSKVPDHRARAALAAAGQPVADVVPPVAEEERTQPPAPAVEESWKTRNRASKRSRTEAKERDRLAKWHQQGHSGPDKSGQFKNTEEASPQGFFEMGQALVSTEIGRIMLGNGTIAGLCSEYGELKDAQDLIDGMRSNRVACAQFFASPEGKRFRQEMRACFSELVMDMPGPSL